MKTLITLAAILVTAVVSASTVKVKVIDDLGTPIPEVDVKIWFSSFVDKASDRNERLSDENGIAIAQGETQVGVFIRAKRAGYYDVASEPYIAPAALIERTYVLPRKLNPIPLFGSAKTNLDLPAQNVWLGFDFEVNDWIAPYGKGKVADIKLKYSNEFKGYLSEGKNLERALEMSKTIALRSGKNFSEDEFKFSAGKWDGVLELSFPNPQEGVYEEEKRFLPYNELKLPHLAPESGYAPKRQYEASTYKGRPPERPIGLFLRTRVKLNAAGKIVSANYAKIYGDIYFDARGQVSFGYYYNPAPNDRNLEYDRSRNLLKLPSVQQNPSYP
jgi:hypothetical protein